MGHICIKECVKRFLKEYSLAKVGFVHYALAHVEKADAWSFWL